MKSDANASLDITARDLATAVFNKVEQSVSGIDRVARVASKSFGLIAAGLAVREIGQAAAAYERIQARLKSLSTTSEDYNAIQQRLFSFAQRTGTSFTTVTESYEKAARAARESGESQEDATRKVLRSLEDQAHAQSGVDSAENRLGNSTTILIGKFGEATGATSLWAATLDGLSRAMDNVTGNQTLDELQEQVAQLEGLKGRQAIGSEGILAAAREKLRVATIASLDQTVRDIDANISALKKKGREMEDALLDSLEIKLPPHKKREPIDLGVRPGDDQGEAFERSAALATARAEAARQEQAQLQQDLAQRFETVRQASLTETESETEALRSRLEILRTSREQGLIDQQRFEDLSIAVAQRAQERLNSINAKGESGRNKVSKSALASQVANLTAQFAQMATVADSGSRTMFAIAKAAAIANAVVAGHQAAALALATPPAPNIPLAALAWGLAGVQIAGIASTNYGGGGGSGGATGGVGASGGGLSSGSPELPRLPAPDSARSAVRIEFHDPHFYGPGGFEQFGDLIADIIKRRVNDRDVIIVDRNSAQAREIRGGT